MIERFEKLKIVATVFLTTLASACISGEFDGDLLLKDVAELYPDWGPSDPGHTEFELLEPYAYIDNSGVRYEVPAGQIVNGASIPREVWAYIGGPWSGRYRNASVVHDYLTEKQLFNSDKVHRLFYEGMIDNGVSRAKALTMYYAVLCCGSSWDGEAGIEITASAKSVSEDQLREIQKKIKNENLSRAQVEALANEHEKN